MKAGNIFFYLTRLLTITGEIFNHDEVVTERPPPHVCARNRANRPGAPTNHSQVFDRHEFRRKKCRPHHHPPEASVPAGLNFGRHYFVLRSPGSFWNFGQRNRNGGLVQAQVGQLRTVHAQPDGGLHDAVGHRGSIVTVCPRCAQLGTWIICLLQPAHHSGESSFFHFSLKGQFHIHSFGT